MEHNDLIEVFGQTVGVEKAEALVAEALDELDVPRKERYSIHEVTDVCETIRNTNDGYVQVVAGELRAQMLARQQFDALLDAVIDPVVIVTFDGSTPVVRGMNRAFEETFGYGSDAVGRELPALIVPEGDRREASNRWFRSDHEGGVEVKRLTADGEQRTFLFRSVVVTRYGGSLEGYGIYTDITVRKRHERSLELQNQQLERFASVVSHDLRNPLAVAQGNLELALEEATDPTVRQLLEQVRDAHERIDTLIADLLELAKQGQAVDDPAPVAVAGIVERAWENVATSDAKLVVEYPEELSIEADATRVCQLFENLFRNCVEHGSASKQPETESTIWVGMEDDVLYVEDDGPGIPEADRERIFEHGYTTSDEGTGFGLAIVTTIAEAHGWTIDVTDGRAGGARFELSGVVASEA